MRLDSIIDGFWQSRRRNLSENTQRDYGLTFRRLTNCIGASADFANISGHDINEFMNWLEDELGLGKKTQKNH